MWEEIGWGVYFELFCSDVGGGGPTRWSGGGGSGGKLFYD